MTSYHVYTGSRLRRSPWVPEPLHNGSVGNSHPSITSTTGTHFLSRSTDAALGSSLPRPTMTTRCGEAKVVFSRPEANCANLSIKRSVITQFKNESVFSVGEDVGFGNRLEKTRDTLVLWSMTRTLREGKGNGWGSVGIEAERHSRCNSRMLSRRNRGNCSKGFFNI